MLLFGHCCYFSFYWDDRHREVLFFPTSPNTAYLHFSFFLIFFLFFLLTALLVAKRFHSLKVTITYEPPVVQRIVPAYGPTHGNTLIRVLGRHFGDANVTGADAPTGDIGGLPCANPVLIHSTELRCSTINKVS